MTNHPTLYQAEKKPLERRSPPDVKLKAWEDPMVAGIGYSNTFYYRADETRVKRCL